MGARQLNVVSYLGAQPLFEGLPPSELARIAADCALRRLSRGDELFRAGQPCEALHLVVDGQVKVYAKAANGHEKVIEVVGPGACVAEALMFSEAAYSFNASVLADTDILVVPQATLVQEIEHNPVLAMRLLAGLSRRLNGLMREIEAVTLHSGVHRVVDYLLRAPRAVLARQADQLTVALPASKGTIASLLSVTPEHFSRILHELQSQGLISVDKRRIHILDAQALASYA